MQMLLSKVTYKWGTVQTTLDQGEVFENKCLKLSSVYLLKQAPQGLQGHEVT